MDKTVQECHELRAKNNYLEMEMQQKANQLQMEEVRREMQAKASSDEVRKKNRKKIFFQILMKNPGYFKN